MEYTDFKAASTPSRLHRYIGVAAGVVFCCGVGLVARSSTTSPAPPTGLSFRHQIANLPETAQHLDNALTQVTQQSGRLQQILGQLNSNGTATLTDDDRAMLSALGQQLQDLQRTVGQAQDQLHSGQQAAGRAVNEAGEVVQQANDADHASRERWESLQRDMMSLLQPGDNGAPRYTSMTVADLQKQAQQYRQQAIDNIRADHDQDRQVTSRVARDVQPAAQVAMEIYSHLFPNRPQDQGRWDDTGYNVVVFCPDTYSYCDGHYDCSAGNGFCDCQFGQEFCHHNLEGTSYSEDAIQARIAAGVQ